MMVHINQECKTTSKKGLYGGSFCTCEDCRHTRAEQAREFAEESLKTSNVSYGWIDPEEDLIGSIKQIQDVLTNQGRLIK